MARILKTAGAAANKTAWQETVDGFVAAIEAAYGDDAYSEDVQAIVDLWLEDPMSFMDREERRPILSTKTGGLGLHRHGDPVQQAQMAKRAAEVREEQGVLGRRAFASDEDVKAHVAGVLSKLGNAR